MVDKDTVLELWRNNMTSNQIGVRLGCSRNVIMGIITRLKRAGVDVDLYHERKPNRGGDRSKGSSAVKAARLKAETKVVEPKPKVVEEEVKPIAKEIIEKEFRRWVPLVETEFKSCRYPRNETRPYSFCNAPTEKGYWCSKHQKKVFTNYYKGVDNVNNRYKYGNSR